MTLPKVLTSRAKVGILGNIKRKPQLRTTDLLGLIALVALNGFIVSAMTAQVFQSDDKLGRARGMVESLAQQIRVEQFSPEPSPSNMRTPAEQDRTVTKLSGSGRIGRDPWGNPFHYNIQKTQALGKKAKAWIYVWSDGPSHEANPGASEIELKQAKGGFKFGPEDIGYALEVLSE